MHITRLLVSLVLASLLGEGTAQAGSLTAGDRQRLVAHLEMTEAWLVSELNGLSDAQLSYRALPGAWSIKDVVEHLGIAEPQYWTQLQDSLKAPATDYKPEVTDAGILWYGIDRTNRARTGEARVPDGGFKTAAEALSSFRKLRATMLEQARRSQRHILQIREVKADAGFPKR